MIAKKCIRDIEQTYPHLEDNAAEPPDMLEAALEYAKRGYHVFPLHNPIFDDDGKCTGCTCEEYRRSEKYRQRLAEQGREGEFDPNFKCPDPGKCPRVAWSRKSTTDEASIRRWWGKPWRNLDVETGRIVYSMPNIGIDAGNSGLLILDKDSYKENYAGDILQVDENTVRSLSGGDGEHLWYQQREGKAYGNASGTLPEGVHVRGDGGYIVAPPSLHRSGRRYRFVEGHALAELFPLPLPQSLVDILEAAQAAFNKTPVNFTVQDPPEPDLAQWWLSAAILDLIRNGAPTGSDRSRCDQSVITALVRAGATDDDIRAVFIHFAIGAKYSEQGDRYLAHSIGKARAWIADHPLESPSPEIMAQLAALRSWAQSAAFVERVAESDIGIKRLAEYQKTFIALVNTL